MPIIDYDPIRPPDSPALRWWEVDTMCRSGRHTFIWGSVSTGGRPPKGLRCCCGETEIEE